MERREQENVGLLFRSSSFQQYEVYVIECGALS